MLSTLVIGPRRPKFGDALFPKRRKHIAVTAHLKPFLIVFLDLPLGFISLSAHCNHGVSREATANSTLPLSILLITPPKPIITLLQILTPINSILQMRFLIETPSPAITTFPSPQIHMHHLHRRSRPALRESPPQTSSSGDCYSSPNDVVDGVSETE